MLPAPGASSLLVSVAIVVIGFHGSYRAGSEGGGAGTDGNIAKLTVHAKIPPLEKCSLDLGKPLVRFPTMKKC